MRKPITGKYDEKVICFVDEFWKRNYRSPSIREVMVSAGIGSTSVAWFVIRKLAKRNDLIVMKNTSRGIVPLWVKTAIEGAAQNA